MSKNYLSGAKWVLKNSSFQYEGVLDDNGHTNLSRIARGEYEFVLSKKGYETKRQKVVVNEKPINLEVSLKKIEKKPTTPPKQKKQKTKTEKTTDKKEEKKPDEKPVTKQKKTKKTTKKTKKTANKKEESVKVETEK